MAMIPGPKDPTWQFVSVITTIPFNILTVFLAIILLDDPLREQVIVLGFAFSVLAFMGIFIHTNKPLSSSQKIGAWMILVGLVPLSALLIGEMPNLISLSTTGGTPISSPAPTLVPTQWHPILKQTVPYCNKLGGAEWYIHSRETAYSCNVSGLIMWQEQPPTLHPYFGEFDLETVQGKYYNQDNFRVKVRVKFLSPSDPSTWAALLVQTPEKRGDTGGYVLALNSMGECILYYVPVNSSTDIKVKGPIFVNIDPSQPITMTIVVRNNELYGYINDQLPLWYHDDPSTLAPSSLEVGLVIEQRTGPQSSKVQFSNFELDKVS